MRYKLVLLIFFALSSTAAAKELALTFDDAPRAANGYFDGPTRAKKLLAELESHNIPQVAFFAVSQNLDEEGRQRLQAYSDAGHIIANHTHSHPDLNQLTLQEYADNVGKADELLQGFPTFRKWFRYPYLREGNTIEKRDGMRAYLKQHGYTNGYVTLNTADWFIESLFEKAIKKGVDVDLTKMEHFYIDVMTDSIEYFDQLAETRLGRSPKHVLLLHETDIAALFVGDLVDALREKGWKIISPEEAYADDIAGYQTQRVMDNNPGRIGEMVLDKNPDVGIWDNSLNTNLLKQRFETEVLGIKTPNKSPASDA